jgi:hypothetical protein
MRASEKGREAFFVVPQQRRQSRLATPQERQVIMKINSEQELLKREKSIKKSQKPKF